MLTLLLESYQSVRHTREYSRVEAVVRKNAQNGKKKDYWREYSRVVGNLEKETAYNACTFCLKEIIKLNHTGRE